LQRAEGEEHAGEGHGAGDLSPAGIGKKAGVQRCGQAAEDGGGGGEFGPAEKEICAQAEKQKGDGRPEVAAGERPGQPKEEHGHVWSGFGRFRAQPVEVHPYTVKSTR
jgi:hypothetical protein